jgi:hypothetical protein
LGLAEKDDLLTLKKRNPMSATFNWSKLLKVLIAVLTAIAGSIGVVSCMS